MKTLLAIAAMLSLTAASGLAATAQATETQAASEARLVVVDGSTGGIVYDDGRDDLFCVSRVHRWRDETAIVIATVRCVAGDSRRAQLRRAAQGA